MKLNSKQKRRLGFAAAIVLSISIGIGLVGYAFRQHIDLYRTPSELTGFKKAVTLRLGGFVKKGTIVRKPGSLTVRFLVTDFKQTVPVEYTGVLPALFKDGQGVIADGVYKSGAFYATRILAKHDEQYKPPHAVKRKR